MASGNEQLPLLVTDEDAHFDKRSTARRALRFAGAFSLRNLYPCRVKHPATRGDGHVSSDGRPAPPARCATTRVLPHVRFFSPREGYGRFARGGVADRPTHAASCRVRTSATGSALDCNTTSFLYIPAA